MRNAFRPFLIILPCVCASRLSAQENIIGTWPVGGGPITVSPIEGTYTTRGFEFVSAGGELMPGSSPAPFEFIIPNVADPMSSVTVVNVADVVTIDGPLTLDIFVSPRATNGDIVGFCADHTTCSFPVRMVPEPTVRCWRFLILLGFVCIGRSDRRHSPKAALVRTVLGPSAA